MIENSEGLGAGELRVEVDGVPWEGGPIPFPNDGAERTVHVRIEPREAARTRSADRAGR